MRKRKESKKMLWVRNEILPHESKTCCITYDLICKVFIYFIDLYFNCLLTIYFFTRMKKFILFCSFIVALFFVIPAQSATVLTNSDQTFLACDQGVPQSQQININYKLVHFDFISINYMPVAFDFISSPPLAGPHKKSNKTKTSRSQKSQISRHYDPGWQLMGSI